MTANQAAGVDLHGNTNFWLVLEYLAGYCRWEKENIRQWMRIAN